MRENMDQENSEYGQFLRSVVQVSYQSLSILVSTSKRILSESVHIYSLWYYHKTIGFPISGGIEVI